MAKKITPNPEIPERSEAQVLFPNLEVMVNGEKVIVKELPLKQLMQYKPLIDDFKLHFDLLDTNPTNDPEFCGKILDMLMDNWQNSVMLVCTACDKEPEWFDTLANDQQEDIFLKWWNVNSGFFYRRLVRKLAIQGVQSTNNQTGG